MENQNLSRPFLIEFNGQFVVNPRMDDNMAFDGRVPASVGDRSNAAVFELSEGYLRKVGGQGPPMHFGRFVVEPLAFMPMPVYWIPEQSMVQPCNYTGEENSPRIFESRGFHIGVLPGDENLVRAMPPHMFPGSEMKVHWQ
ncbi:hypothetical protein GT037_000026 [Alternaria burnsii]|uniref:Uncharacterized protein n=1 Tax=Alternaria burnsii TaxID=1187904 RepID=A0A8H7BB39_9PLEO|nr:uncharacterized protein GT037_000026 [Alternaria burnsii]KAF7681050.1 hypothetical protein GT037_000026 [Alternaria burnsii]